MTLGELLRRFRTLADDNVAPYLWDTKDVTDWLSDAQEQAAIRGRLLREDQEPGICSILLDPTKHTYRLHPVVVEIIFLQLLPANGERGIPLELVSRDWLDAERPDWRDDPNPPRFAIQDDVSLRIVGRIEVGDSLRLECYRLPLKPLSHAAEEPELHRAHHVHLVNWALHRAFSVPDAEKFDPVRGDNAEKAFTQYFGLLPDSDMRRITRADVVHHNRAVLL